MSAAALLDELRAALGPAAVLTDDAALGLASGDLFVTGVRPLAVVRPGDGAGVAAALVAAANHGHAVIPRGGGLSYTGGYTPPHGRTISFDLSAMNRVLAVAAEDMTVTVQAGTTWRDIDLALRPRGLRLPFFGTFSGAGATVGGGLSHGALFFGSARYGPAAEQVLGLEVALADGRLLRTGTQAVRAAPKPYLRSYGPDLTGLFVHDGGAFGIKTEASFRLIQGPRAEDCASFAFASLPAAAAALSAVARAELAEEVYVLDPATTGATDLETGAALRTGLRLLRGAGGVGGALRLMADVARGGQRPIPPGAWSLHLVAAGRSSAAVAADLAAARAIARDHGGTAVAATIPRATRADLFASLDGVLDTDGRRWAAVNAKVAHGDAQALLAAFDALIVRHRPAMAALGVSVTQLVSAVGNHCFSYEVVFHWPDSWQPLHRAAASAAYLAARVEPVASPAARALVDELHAATIALFRARGAASNQLGRCYPFLDVLEPATATLLGDLKKLLDPRGMMNPGVLGFAAPAADGTSPPDPPSD
jgi:FAD/FMN-containing dehydrogenase